MSTFIAAFLVIAIAFSALAIGEPGIISPDRVMGIFDYGRAAYRRRVVLTYPF